MYMHPWNYTLRNEILLEVPGEKALQQGKGRKTLAWRRTSWKESRIWKGKMCIYFLLLSWALVPLFEVGYLNFPPVSNLPGKENRRFCLLKQPHQAPTGQGKSRTGAKPASKNAMAPFPKYLCAVHWRTCAEHVSGGKDEGQEHHCCLLRSKGDQRPNKGVSSSGLFPL